MRVLAIVHEAWAGPGVFGEVFQEGGDALDEWMLPERPEPPADPVGYDAVFVLGGAKNVDQGGEHGWRGDERGVVGQLPEHEVPPMGLCLGGQMVAASAGTVPRRAPRPEIGGHEVELTAAGRDDPLLGPLGPRFEACRIGEVAWALQFHPEVSRADALAWTADWRSDPDAVAIETDPTALALEIEAKIDAFNELGRDICRRWLDVAAAHA